MLITEWAAENIFCTLAHRHMSMSYKTTQQGSVTVQDLLNRLTKFATCMVEPPGQYMQQKQVLVALRELLHHEVLSQGRMAEFSHMEDLVSTAQQWRTPCAMTWAHSKLRDKVATILPLRDPYQWGYG